MTEQAAARPRKEVIFRADANATIGTGHLARSATLADELRAHGWLATFATRNLADVFRADLRRRGHDVFDLDCELDQEPIRIAERLAGRSVALTVIDHYAIGAPWQTAARRWSRLLMAIDDLASTAMDVDLILNQNLGEEERSYADLAPHGTRLLVGPRYALLRPEFAANRGDTPRIRASVNRLLIFMSGADEVDVTAVAAAAAEQTGIATDVVIGGAYPHETRLRAAFAGSRGISIHRNATNMAQLMGNADLAVGAPSSASWERCCLALPALTITLAQNQVRVGAALEMAGAAVNLGWYTHVDAVQLSTHLRELASAPERLAAMSRAAATVTDGRGAARVRATIDELAGSEGEMYG